MSSDFLNVIGFLGLIFTHMAISSIWILLYADVQPENAQLILPSTQTLRWGPGTANVKKTIILRPLTATGCSHLALVIEISGFSGSDQCDRGVRCDIT
jgi:hypothetical protein